MAESLLFTVAESLIGKLTSRAIEEASLTLGVYRDLQDMKDKMALIKAFMLDAEHKKPHNNVLSEWLRQIKHVFSDAEDIVDDFECTALRKRVVNMVAAQRLAKVAAQRDMFGLQINEKDTHVVDMREMTHSHVNHLNVIAREDDKNKIMKLLLQDGHDKSLSVIPIVGMGGLGKTTLAKLVFNEITNIDECFPLKMWVCVSNNFELRIVLIKIRNSAPNPTSEKLENFETEQLQNHLRHTLQDQKFLLILDDVWEDDNARWDELKEIIIDTGVEGSKILVTTRSPLIATLMCSNSSNSYLLEGLSKDDSFYLFLKLAFKEGEDKKHSQLLEIGR
ncbi:Disease resistance protein RGA2 [Glycine soja]|uniref:Disease resistance protein RGA2 n=1 Tax=Glycine soja TaxID=3848 RepID=A0A0B2SMZ9_GLYSO|nr:Disease resistance protein RGA2 [Glycine soja]